MVLYILFQTVTADEIGEDDQPEQKRPKSSIQQRPGEAEASLSNQMGLRPLADLPEALRQLPALSLLSRLVSQGAQSSPSDQNLQPQSDKGNSRASGTGSRDAEELQPHSPKQQASLLIPGCRPALQAAKGFRAA